MACDHCETLQEEIVYLQSELGLREGLDHVEAIRIAFHVPPAVARLILCLYRAKGKPVTYLQALDTIPARDADDEDDRNPHIVNVYVSRIRKAMGPGIVRTIWATGYQLTPAGLDVVGLALGVERPVSGLELQDLTQRPSGDLRVLAAHVAGILAHRDGDGGAQTAIVYRRITDRLTSKPRIAA